MDPLTHIAAGALAGQAVRKWFSGKAVLLFSIVAAVVPDIDNLVGGTNPEMYLLHHRGITHSLVGGAGIAVLLAVLFRPVLRERPLRVLFLIGFGSLLSHIFLDLVTSYGTQILLPFTNERYTLQSVFIIDPVFTFLLLACLAFSLWNSKKRTQVAMLGLCIMLFYPFMTLSVRLGLSSALGAQLKAEGVRYERLHLSPELLTPYRWKMIIEDRDSFRLADISLRDLGGHISFSEFRKADLSLMEDLGAQASMFKTYRWFSLYPVMENSATPEGRRITFGDLRFYSAAPFMRDIWRKGRPPFLLTAVIDRSGTLRAYEYSRPRGSVFVRTLN